MSEVVKLDPEVKRRWLEALRSGDFEQGRAALNSDGRYCCLGVLCEIAVGDGVCNEVAEFDDVAYGGQTGILPEVVRVWASADSENKVISTVKVAVTGKLQELIGKHSMYGGRPHVNLTDLNDAFLLNFNQIADVIEEQL